MAAEGFKKVARNQVAESFPLLPCRECRRFENLQEAGRAVDTVALGLADFLDDGQRSEPLDGALRRRKRDVKLSGHIFDRQVIRPPPAVRRTSVARGRGRGPTTPGTS